MNRRIIIYIIFILSSCIYGVNATTSHIGSLNTHCVTENAWNEILNEYSVDNIEDSILSSTIAMFKGKPFPSKLLYFPENPEEVIGVSINYYTVRYVYNSEISTDVLDGMSLNLVEEEKVRIINRVNKVIKKYQCK